MIYEKFKVQDFFHRRNGSPTPQKYKEKKKDFQNIVLSQTDVDDIFLCAVEDAEAYFQKGLHSLCEGVLDMSNSFYSWSTVKLYYSIFYFLRSASIFHGYVTVRWVELYYVKNNIGESPTQKLMSGCRNDHAFTCGLFENIIKNDDIFNTNTIDNINPYTWYMKQREYANYKSKKFSDPLPWDCWDFFASKKKETLQTDIQHFIDDTLSRKFIFCFQPDTAILAMPIARAIETKKIITDYIPFDKAILHDSFKFFKSKKFASNFAPIIDSLLCS